MTSVPGTSLKDQVKKFIEIQKLDSEIYEMKVQLQEKPALVDELKKEFETKKANLHGLEDHLKKIQVKRKDIELELKGKEDGILKNNTQLNAIKTNKEYTAKLSEIESLKADISVLEEKILLTYDESDKFVAEIEKEKAKVSQEEKQYLTKKKEVDDQIKIINDRMQVLDAQRKGIIPNLDKNLLPVYERLVAHKEGLAVVPVIKGSSCGGCFMNVPHQIINALKIGNELVRCEFCSRILYLENEA